MATFGDEAFSFFPQMSSHLPKTGKVSFLHVDANFTLKISHTPCRKASAGPKSALHFLPYHS